MSRTPPIPTSAVESIDAFLGEAEKFVKFIDDTTRDEREDAQLWCRYVGLAYREMAMATEQAMSYLIGYAIVAGAQPTAVATAGDISYYLTRTALLGIPVLADRLGVDKVKAEHIADLRALGLDAIGDFGPFGTETTYWGSWFGPSKAKARITSTLRAALTAWMEAIAESIAIAKTNAADQSVDSAVWALRLLTPLGAIRNTLTTATNHSIRFAFDIGMVDSNIAKSFEFGRRSLRGRIEGTESLIADESFFMGADSPPTVGAIGPMVTVSSDGNIVSITHGPAVIAHGVTYSEALRTLFRRSSAEQTVKAILVVGDAIPPGAAPVLMERYGLERIDFTEAAAAVA